MYSSFFGFSEKPFEVTPDPKFLYLNTGYRETQSSLLYGIRERRGFIAVVGEAGTGKTTLLRSVLDSLEEGVKVAYVFNTDLSFEEMLRMVLVDLDLAREEEAVNKVDALQRLNDLAVRQLAAGGNVVIMVDEAQNLDRRCMENLRLLSNLETSKNKLIQIILSGQPELEEKLRQPDLRQLSQRINLRRYILPFNEKETREYILHRLKVARYDGPALFTEEAETLIWQYSGGIPRKINTVCDNALLTGYALKKRKIGGDMVREVIDDLSRNPFPDLSGPRPEAVAARAEPREALPARRRFGSGVFIIVVACLSLMTGFGLGALGLHLNRARQVFHVRNQVQASIPEMQARSSGPIPVPVRTKPVVSSALPAAPSETALPAAQASAGHEVKEAEMPPAPKQAEPPAGSEAKPVVTAVVPQAPPERALPGAQALRDPVAPKVEASPAREPAERPPIQVQAVKETNEKAQSPARAKPEPVPADPSRETSVAKAGDTIFSIILRHYGRYNWALERKVLEANPRIKDRDRIYAGQRIAMPDVTH